MKNVIYRVCLNIKESNGQFKKELVETLTDEQNPYLEVAKWRKANVDSEYRYVLGHVK